MAGSIEFDGPRLLRRGEAEASERLSRLCFGNEITEELILKDAGANSSEPESGAADEEENSPDHPSTRAGSETLVIASQGRPVSQIIITPETLKVYGSPLRIGCIGGVCTHPDYRGYRLATRLLETCALRLRAGGSRLMLISGGRGLYTRTGNVFAGKYAFFALQHGFSPAVKNAGQETARLRPARAEDAALCRQLYQAEPVHYMRGLSSFSGHLGQPHDGYHAEEWIIEMDGRPAAYLLLTVPWEDLHDPSAGVRWVCEYAGSRAALASACAAALRQGLVRELRLPVPWQDFDMISMLIGGNAHLEWMTLPDHTMRLLNFPGLMDDLRPFLRARLGRSLLSELRFSQSGPVLCLDNDDGACAITLKNDRLELSTAQMTRLVMGCAGDDPLQESGVEAPASLREAVSALFPLPAFLTGLNYH